MFARKPLEYPSASVGGAEGHSERHLLAVRARAKPGALKKQKPHRSHVDIALCSVMRDCALRREEAVRIVMGRHRITPEQKALRLTWRSGRAMTKVIHGIPDAGNARAI